MNELTDQQLLAAYGERQSEPAFTELVRRHIDLVHSAAFRMTGEAHSAQDVTQAVFVALAWNAARLAHHPVLSGWLHTTARNLAAKNVRANVRRQSHEQEAASMNEILSSAPDVPWEQIAPHLDAALGELSESDRHAVMLRYFEKKSAPEMARCLGVSEDAAQKRVSRAVERLRDIFAAHGIAVGAGGLVALISVNAVQAAPVGLAVTIGAVAFATTAISTSAVVATTSKTIAMTALQKTFATAAVAVLAGACIYEAHRALQLGDQLQTLRQQQALLTEQNGQLQIQSDEMRRQLAQAQDEVSRSGVSAGQSEILQLRDEVATLRRATNELANVMADRQKLGEEALLTPDDVFKLRRLQETEAMGNLLTALKEYSDKHNGGYPLDLNELISSTGLRPTNFAGGLGLADFILLDPPAVDFRDRNLILRNRNPISRPNGDPEWVYGAINTNGVPTTITTTARYGN